MKAPFCTVAKRRLTEKLFSVFEIGFKFANTLAEHGMKFVRAKFGKRIEDEIPILHIDMRYAQVAVFNHAIVVKNHVDIMVRLPQCSVRTRAPSRSI